MDLYEIEALMENMYLKNKDSWEQTRMVTYITAQANSSKQLDPKDLITFPWEKETVKCETSDDLEALMAEAKLIENKLNNR